ncbi:MAG TPA: hypothetical protein VGD40_00915 [Chryseosolibacter sp.]
MGLTFRKLSNRSADTLGITSVYLPEANVELIPREGTTSIDVPVNLYSTSTLIVVQAAGIQYDITVNYLTKTQFVSEDCGAKFVLSELQAVSETFDSVRVSSSVPKPLNASGTNIEIFRCPNTSLLKIQFASAVAISTIEGSHIGTIAGPSEATTTLTLPLNTAEPLSTFIFTFSDGLKKTLSVAYELETDELFNACGEQVLVSQLALTTHDFTTATLARPAIQDSNQPNIEITF